MDNNALLAFTITFVAGASTAIGALAAFFVRKKDFKTIAFAMSFSAGVMIFVSFADIMPMSAELFGRSFSETKAEAATFAMFFAGALIAGIIDRFVPEHITTEMLDKSGVAKKTNVRKAAIMTSLALAVHNFPEGLSVFFSTLEDTRMGLALGFAILLHNIPEGISVALPAYQSTGSRKKAFWLSTCSGLVEPFGALCAYFVFAPFLTPTLVGACMAITAGLMVYIALDELLPMAKEYDEQHSAIVGVFLGMAVIALSGIATK